MAWLKPETEEIRRALRRYAPHLAEEPIEFLSEGWEFWAFTAGDYVLRFPRPEVDLHRLPEGTTNFDSLHLEMALLPTLAEALSAPVPHIDVYGEDRTERRTVRGPSHAPRRAGTVRETAARPRLRSRVRPAAARVAGVPGSASSRAGRYRTWTERRCGRSAGKSLRDR